MAIFTCPNCRSRFHSKFCVNQWVKWYEGLCDACGFSFKLKDSQFDLVQPSHPLFNEIYKDRPYEKLKKEKDEKDWERENQKDDRETNLRLKVKKGKLKPWEIKTVKSLAEEYKLDG